MLSQTEDALIQRLTTFLPADIEVIPLPDTPSDLARPFERGQVCVYFAGLSGRPGPGTSGSVETRHQVWQLLLRHRHKRTGGGLYALIDSCRALLSGYLPPACAGRMQLLEESAPEVLDGIWVSFMTFAVPAANLPLPDPETVQKLVRATWHNDPHHHTTTVEKPA